MSIEAMKQAQITKEDLLQEWIPRLWDALKNVRQNNNAAAEEAIYELYVEMKQQTLAEKMSTFSEITLEDQLSAMALDLIATKKRLAEVELIMCQKHLEAEKQEPVAYSDENGKVIWLKGVHKKTNLYERLQPAQPKREWVGLTDEEMAKAIGFTEFTVESTKTTLTYVARAIEAKLKEKNT